MYDQFGLLYGSCCGFCGFQQGLKNEEKGEVLSNLELDMDAQAPMRLAHWVRERRSSDTHEHSYMYFSTL